MMNTEFTIRYIKYTTEMWKKKRKEVFSYDHSNVDYLFITIHMENGEEQYLAYSMSERNNGRMVCSTMGTNSPKPSSRLCND